MELVAAAAETEHIANLPHAQFNCIDVREPALVYRHGVERAAHGARDAPPVARGAVRELAKTHRGGRQGGIAVIEDALQAIVGRLDHRIGESAQLGGECRGVRLGRGARRRRVGHEVARGGPQARERRPHAGDRRRRHPDAARGLLLGLVGHLLQQRPVVARQREETFAIGVRRHRLRGEYVVDAGEHPATRVGCHGEGQPVVRLGIDAAHEAVSEQSGEQPLLVAELSERNVLERCQAFPAVGRFTPGGVERQVVERLDRHATAPPCLRARLAKMREHVVGEVMDGVGGGHPTTEPVLRWR